MKIRFALNGGTLDRTAILMSRLCPTDRCDSLLWQPLLLQPRELRPSVILLDEPELGLHPSAITILASLIKQVSVETQIVLATQSSLLLDHFTPEDVLVAERVKGATQFARLDGEKLKIWLEDYSLGQLWEKNEFGGRPTPEFIGQGAVP